MILPYTPKILQSDKLPLTLKGTAYSWRFVPDRRWSLPDWPGSMLRGALGWALETEAGHTPAPDWPGLSPDATFARALFDPQGAWNHNRAMPVMSLRVTSRYRRCDDLRPLEGVLTVWGEQPPWAKDLLEETFRAMALRGLGTSRTTAKLDSFLAAELPQLAKVEPIDACQMKTQTPARLKDGKTICTTLSPPAIARSILRRYRGLCQQVMGVDPYADGLGAELHRKAANLEARQMICRNHTLDRKSSRQGRHSIPDAVSGEVEIVGTTLQDFAPLFAMAPHLHIGRQPNFGFGAVEVTLIPGFCNGVKPKRPL